MRGQSVQQETKQHCHWVPFRPTNIDFQVFPVYFAIVFIIFQYVNKKEKNPVVL